MPIKINSIFIQPDTPTTNKPFCGICRVYMRYTEQRGYQCQTCGTVFEDKTQEPDILQNKYSGNPQIFNKKRIAQEQKRKNQQSDFPQGAYIVKDEEIR